MIQTGAFVAGEGEMNALDDLCSTRNTLGAGAGERSHDWRVHSYPAGHRDRCGTDQDHSGAQTVLTST